VVRQTHLPQPGAAANQAGIGEGVVGRAEGGHRPPGGPVTRAALAGMSGWAKIACCRCPIGYLLTRRVVRYFRTEAKSWFWGGRSGV